MFDLLLLCSIGVFVLVGYLIFIYLLFMNDKHDESFYGIEDRLIKKQVYCLDKSFLTRKILIDVYREIVNNEFENIDEQMKIILESLEKKGTINYLDKGYLKKVVRILREIQMLKL